MAPKRKRSSGSGLATASKKKAKKTGPGGRGTGWHDLPAELRNAIYELVYDSDPCAYVPPRSRSLRALTHPSPLARLNRATREEFLSTVSLLAPTIRAHVIDFKFGSLISFLNRLSEEIKKEPKRAPAARNLVIELDWSYRTTADFDQLHRWYERVSRLSKLVPGLTTEYVAAVASPKDYVVKGSRTLIDALEESQYSSFEPSAVDIEKGRIRDVLEHGHREWVRTEMAKKGQSMEDVVGRQMIREDEWGGPRNYPWETVRDVANDYSTSWGFWD